MNTRDDQSRAFWKWLPAYAITTGAITTGIAAAGFYILAPSIRVDASFVAFVIIVGGLTIFAWYAEAIIAALSGTSPRKDHSGE